MNKALKNAELLVWKLAHRQTLLGIMVVYLRGYERTGDEKYLENAKWCGVETEKLQKEIDEIYKNE